MPARPSSQGHLRLSLVTCPVALYPATSEAETVRFNLINPETNDRIKMQTLDAGTGEPVSRSDLVKGYQIAKGEYVILSKDDFESVKLESTRTLDIEKFVPRESINRLYWDVPYHLLPGGKTGIEAFAIIREAMRKTGMVALGRLVMSTRERICALEVEEDTLLMTTLRTAEEVRAVQDIDPAETMSGAPGGGGDMVWAAGARAGRDRPRVGHGHRHREAARRHSGLRPRPLHAARAGPDGPRAGPLQGSGRDARRGARSRPLHRPDRRREGHGHVPLDRLPVTRVSFRATANRLPPQAPDGIRDQQFVFLHQGPCGGGM
jgi:Ku protein